MRRFVVGGLEVRARGRARRASITVLVLTGAVLLGGAPAGAGATMFSVGDPSDDVVDAQTGAPVSDRLDLSGVEVLQTDEGHVVVRVVVDCAPSVGARLRRQFSGAVVVRARFPEGTQAGGVFEFHDGQETRGVAKDTPTGPTVTEDAEGRAVFDFGAVPGFFDAGALQIDVFNIPVEGRPASVDDRVIEFAGGRARTFDRGTPPGVEELVEPGEGDELCPEPAGEIVAGAPAEQEDEDEEGDGLSALVVIAPLVGIGVVVLVGTRARRGRRVHTVDREGEGTSAVPREGAVPGDEIVPGVGLADRCDWAVYFEGSTQTEILRAAQHHECCVYRISVTTTVERDDQRVDRSRTQENERLSVPHTAWSGYGLNSEYHAAARTGPEGDLGWMQGLGDTDSSPAGAGGDDRTSPLPAFMQPFDVSAWVDAADITVIEVRLESNCVDHENTYACDGTSTVSLTAGHECTNEAPGEPCPVEVLAVGTVSGGASVDLQYLASVQAGYDATAAPPVASGGTARHRHPERARDSREESGSTDGKSTVEGDSLRIEIRNSAELAAALTVPAAVAGQTERVSAAVDAMTDNAVNVSAAMTAECQLRGCFASILRRFAPWLARPRPCCNRKLCDCLPSFRLALLGAYGTVEVDGVSWPLDLDLPDGDLEPGVPRPWNLGKPGGH